MKVRLDKYCILIVSTRKNEGLTSFICACLSIGDLEFHRIVNHFCCRFLLSRTCYVPRR